MVDGKEATDPEAQTSFQKKTPPHQIRPAFAGSRTRQIGSIKRSYLLGCAARIVTRSMNLLDWYCSEPRLAFNRIVVLRYRSHLESRQLAPGTVNLRLGVQVDAAEESGKRVRA